MTHIKREITDPTSYMITPYIHYEKESTIVWLMNRLLRVACLEDEMKSRMYRQARSAQTARRCAAISLI